MECNKDGCIWMDGSSRHSRKKSVKMELSEPGCELDSDGLRQDLLAVLCKPGNGTSCSIQAENFLTSCVLINFSGKTLFMEL
jgi:hypothetical protein